MERNGAAHSPWLIHMVTNNLLKMKTFYSLIPPIHFFGEYYEVFLVHLRDIVIVITQG